MPPGCLDAWVPVTFGANFDHDVRWRRATGATAIRTYDPSCYPILHALHISASANLTVTTNLSKNLVCSVEYTAMVLDWWTMRWDINSLG